MKIVYNACFGGFGLSLEAQELYAKKIGAEIVFEKTTYGWEYHYIVKDGKHIYDYQIPRHDPHLVEVVEELGSKASSWSAKLEIREITGNQYMIDEYDGSEEVITPYDAKSWVTVDMFD